MEKKVDAKEGSVGEPCHHCSKPIVARAIIRNDHRFCSNRCVQLAEGAESITYWNGARLTY